jgi:hypothetical protein
MASGMARGARERGKRIAFGDGKKIIWDVNSPLIFRGNPNVAPPGSEGAPDLEWIPFHRGHRIYNTQGAGHWIWNYEFRPTPGQMFLDEEERRFARSVPQDLVIIEPNVPWHKSVAANKDWGFANYQELAKRLGASGYKIAQFSYGKHKLGGARLIPVKSFRHALAALRRAKLVICPEGGLHHGAAAMNVQAVVLFGGFIPPQVTGYDTHTNLTGGETHFCGSLGPCQHCKAAMRRITVEEVYKAAIDRIQQGVAA